MPRTSDTNGIACPKCGAFGASVDRTTPNGGVIRRQRSCSCGVKFATVERLAAADPYQAAIDSRALEFSISILAAHRDSMRDSASGGGVASGN